MARVKKFLTPNYCKCGSEPEIHQWTDSKTGRSVACIVCVCGMSTKAHHSKDMELARKHAIQSWNKTSRRRNIKGGLRSCEKCGSNDVIQIVFEHEPTNATSYMINCENCGLRTDEIDNSGNLRSDNQSREIWNS